MRPYVEANISPRNKTTIDYSIKLMAHIAEMMIFIFLGIVTSSVFDTEDPFEWSFNLWNILFVTIVRFLVVFALGFILNLFSMRKLSFKDQFIGKDSKRIICCMLYAWHVTYSQNKLSIRFSEKGLKKWTPVVQFFKWNRFCHTDSYSKIESFKVAFSGLRGGIAFGMIYSLQIQNRMMYIQTTLIIIFFTVFIQGSSVGPLLNFLKGTRRNWQDLNGKKTRSPSPRWSPLWPPGLWMFQVSRRQKSWERAIRIRNAINAGKCNRSSIHRSERRFGKQSR